jgi:hypothetical protein
MGQEDGGADQTHYRCHHFEHCKKSFTPLRTEENAALAQSKRFTGADAQSESTEDFAQHVFQNGQLFGPPESEAPRAQPLIHHRMRLPISAVIRLRYLSVVDGAWAARRRELPN